MKMEATGYLELEDPWSANQGDLRVLTMALHLHEGCVCLEGGVVQGLQPIGSWALQGLFCNGEGILAWGEH